MNFLLFLLSFIYRLGCQFKNWLYTFKIFKPKKAPLPIISVGNITFGGSEKTPLVMNIISFILGKGYKPALLTRGYKGRWERKGGILSDGKIILGNWEDSGDEPYMVADNIPKAGIFVGKNRFISAQKAASLGFDVGILDDGFQDRLLHRDLDIVLYDQYEKLALREPLSSLKRAHFILIKKRDKAKKKKNIKKYFSHKAIFEYKVISKGFFELGEKDVIIPSEKIKGKKVVAFCGLARPQRFLLLLQKQGIQPEIFLKFPDHHSYPPSSLEKIFKKFNKAGAEALIMTEKDAVKVAESLKQRKVPSYFLKIGLQVESEFYSKILFHLQKWIISSDNED